MIENNSIGDFERSKIYLRNHKKYIYRSKLMIKDTILFVEEAPEPGDIAWENQNFSTKKKIAARLTTIIKYIILLIICVGIIGLIKYSQFLVKKNNPKQALIIQLLSFMIGLVITMFNKFGLSFLVRKLVR